MIEILKYILAGFSGSILTYWLMILGFKYLIESKSLKMDGLKLNGKTYFFMTQDQIQKALESLYKFESHGLPDEGELNG
jgi:hypothetical protein